MCMAKTFELDDDSMRRINCKRKRKKKFYAHQLTKSNVKMYIDEHCLGACICVQWREIVCGYQEKGNQMKNMHSIQVKIITVIDLAIVVVRRIV